MEYQKTESDRKNISNITCMPDVETKPVLNVWSITSYPYMVLVLFFLEQSVGLPITWLLRCSTDRATAQSLTCGPSDVSCESFYFKMIIRTIPVSQRVCWGDFDLGVTSSQSVGKVGTFFFSLNHSLLFLSWLTVALIALSQVHTDVWKPSFWDARLERDVQVY